MKTRKAFTLIELLVVIAILGLLLAVLLPTLGRIRKQARATACQMTLRHWGVVFSMYTNEYNDRFLSNDRTDWWMFARHYYADCNELLVCPMATRYEVNKNAPKWVLNLSVGYGAGSKFTAWRVPNHLTGGRQVFYGSYGLNWLVLEHYGSSPSGLKPISPPARSRFPFLLDCVQTGGYGRWQSGPPVYDGDLSEPYPQMKHFCIDRHEATINTLFSGWVGAKGGPQGDWVRSGTGASTRADPGPKPAASRRRTGRSGCAGSRLTDSARSSRRVHTTAPPAIRRVERRCVVPHPTDLFGGENQSPRRAFTLIELLVVIATIAMLMAVLLPTLARVRRQARAVGCQAKLREWGTLYATAIAENNGQWPDRCPPGAEAWSSGWAWWTWGGWWGNGPPGPRDQEWYDQTKDLFYCPMATRPADTVVADSWAGGTFLAWKDRSGYVIPSEYYYGSYGLNRWAHPYWYPTQAGGVYLWNPANARNGAQVPMCLDSCWFWTELHDSQPPPLCDAIPTRQSAVNVSSCINRHDGYVNGLFLDWSVRRVGLKELWTLKWHRQSNTMGPWTKAGGVQPEDWPQWLRRFKDY